jgi:hypothetical protein
MQEADMIVHEAIILQGLSLNSREMEWKLLIYKRKAINPNLLG